jgi:MFS family permease
MPSAHRAEVYLLLALSAHAGMSNFFRASYSVLGPELTRDLALSPQLLSLAAGSFFMALAVLQIPVGMLFDRFGPRRTVLALSGLAVVGSAVHGVAQTPAVLIASRFLIGFGCAGSFVAAIVLCSYWFAGPRFTTRLSWVFVFSNAGTFLASAPLAAATAWLGWRSVSFWQGGLMALVAVAFALGVRDYPPHGPPPVRPHESPREVIRGLGKVLRAPGMWRVLAMHMFIYASLMTVLGLWAGPYLKDVHGFDAVTRGNILFAMTLAQTVGLLLAGPLERFFNTRKWVAIGGACITITLLGALALIPHPGPALAVALLLLHCGLTSYSVVVVAHGRSLYADHLAGRGVTLVNLSQLIGLTVLPIATGAVIGTFPVVDGASPEAAYRWAFGCMAAALAAGTVVYVGVLDAKPRGTAAAPAPAVSD